MRLIFTSVLLVMAGCLDIRATYREPLPDAPAATVTGIGGVYITEINGARVESGQAVSASNGNRARLGPGTHNFKASVVGSEGGRLFDFNFLVVAGRKYELSTDPENALNLIVRDLSTGKAVYVN